MRSQLLQLLRSVLLRAANYPWSKALLAAAPLSVWRWAVDAACPWERTDACA